MLGGGLGMVGDACNPSTGEAERKGSKVGG